MITLMTVLGLLVLATGICLAIGLVTHSMLSCPFWMIYHWSCGTLSALVEGLGLVLQALGEAVAEALSGS